MREAERARTLDAARFVELDGLRGIAALSVVLMHYTTLFDGFFPDHRPFPVHLEWGGLGVQLFFMISGFVIVLTTTRHPSPARFALARALRLYPAYWVCLALTIALTWNVGALAQGWRVNLVNATMLQSFLRVRDLDGSYWSLAIELSFYALVTVLLWLGRGTLERLTLLALVIVWPLVGAALHAAVYHGASEPLRLVEKGIAGEYAALFALGIVMSQVRAGRRQWLALAVPLVALALVAHALTPGSSFTPALAGIIAVFVIVTLRDRTGLLRVRALTWLGAVSFPLYLLHQNIGYAILLATADPLGPWLSRIVTLALVVLLAWAVHEVIEMRLGGALARTVREHFDEPRPRKVRHV